MNIDYFHTKTIVGNEAVFEQAIDSIKNKTFTVAENYPFPLVLPSGKKILASAVIDYYSAFRLLNGEEIITVCENIRKCHPEGFREISYSLDLWIERSLGEVYFKKEKKNFATVWELKDSVDQNEIDLELIELTCYVAVSHIKYGASYESITANHFFRMVEDLGFDHVKRLKNEGTGLLPLEITTYKDNNLVCKANDVFAVIDISIKNECEAAYAHALDFINQLFSFDFPKSYTIKFRSKIKDFLPVKGMPKKSVNTFFANAVKYPALYPRIEQYARQAMNRHEWYTDMDDEACLMTSSFAVFALGLIDKRYFNLVKQYFETCDDEHSSLQTSFIPVFIEKYGVTSESLPVILSAFFSYQSTEPNKITTAAFANKEALSLLLEVKKSPEKYVLCASELGESCWEIIRYCIFGKHPAKTTKAFPEDCRVLINELL